MGVHWIDSPSKQSICIGILVLEAPCRSDKSFSENTQIYFPAHTEQQIIFPYSLLYEKGSESQCLCGFPDSNVHFLFIILHIFIFYNLLFWELIWLERMKCEALANISRVMTNERSFSVVNASAPVGTTDKLSDFYLTCLVFHQITAAHLKMLVITSPSVR